MLLCCATPESIVRLENSALPAASRQEIEHIYFKEQCHENVFEFLHHVFVKSKPADSLHLQVCTFCCEICFFCLQQNVTDLIVRQTCQSGLYSSWNVISSGESLYSMSAYIHWVGTSLKGPESPKIQHFIFRL